jgi:hypothetical protein
MIITTKTDQRNDQIKDYWRRFHAEKQALYKKQIIKGCIIAPFIFLLPYIFAILLLSISGKSFATGLADLKFGSAQIADSQWNVQACTQTATCQIYSKNPGTVYKIPWTSGQLSWVTGDYVAFAATGNGANPWNAVQYNSAGTQKAVMGTGHIINMGTDYFFFVGNDNDTGQLFSMTQGFANTGGVTWTGTLNPTISQVNTYAANGSTTPLAAGQSAPPPGTQTVTYTNFLTFQTWDVEHYNANGWSGTTGGSITNGWTWSCTNCGSTTSGTVDRVTRSSDDTVIFVYILDANGNMVISEPNGAYTYSGVPVATGPVIEGGTITQTNAPTNQTFTSGGTSSAGPSNEQQTRYNAWNNGIQATDNYLYIEQVSGNYNTVNITQSGVKNTMDLGINGSSNTVNATQTGENYLNALVQGNTNAVTSLQTNTSGTHYQETKIMSGNNNTINVTQKDNGNSLMFNTIAGNSNTISAVQEGAGNHYLENKLTGNGNSVLANQSGSTGNKANIDLTNAGGAASVDLQQTGGKAFTIIQSCANPAGCSTVIRQ